MCIDYILLKYLLEHAVRIKSQKITLSVHWNLTDKKMYYTNVINCHKSKNLFVPQKLIFQL